MFVWEFLFSPKNLIHQNSSPLRDLYCRNCQELLPPHFESDHCIIKSNIKTAGTQRAMQFTRGDFNAKFHGIRFLPLFVRADYYRARDTPEIFKRALLHVCLTRGEGACQKGVKGWRCRDRLVKKKNMFR